VAVDRQLVEFTRDDFSEVVELIRRVVDAGAGWVNIEPILDEEAMDEVQRTTPPAVIRLFSGRGGKIPFGTFVAGDKRKGGVGQLGLEHGAGPRVVPQLREAGIALPEGWRIRQDHGKRGIVCDVPPTEDPTVIVQWIVAAAMQLTEVRLSGWWTAVIHTPR
jgi:hypothetical protein